MIAIAYALVATVAWTANLLLVSQVMRIWPAGWAGGLSRLISTGIIGLWILSSRAIGWRRLRFNGQGRRILMMGFVAVAVNVCLFTAMKWTTAANAALLYRSDLLFVILIGWFGGVERITWAGWLVMPVMFAGMALIMQVQYLQWTGRLGGDILVLLAAFFYAVNAFVIRGILHHLGEHVVAFYNNLLCASGFAVLALIQRARPPTDIVAWGWLVALGVAGSISLPLYYAALHRMPVWKLRVFMLLSPLMAAGAGWLIWGQRLRAGQWVGAVLLLAGAVVLILSEARAMRLAGLKEIDE